MGGSERYSGGCHCGGVRYVFSTPFPPEQWSVRRCTCSYCTRFGAAYTSGPDSRLEVTVQDPSLATDYEFGTKTAKFFRCNRCGVMIFARSRIEGSDYAVLNVNTLDDGGLPLSTGDTDFDAETLEDRLARRQTNWIPDVTIRFANT